MTMAMRTVRDIEYNRPTGVNHNGKSDTTLHGIRVQVAENARELWWIGNDKTGKQVPLSLCMPLEIVPEIVQAQLDFVNYTNIHGKASVTPTAGEFANKKQPTALKFYVVSREERGEIVFALIAAGFTEAAQEEKLHQIENFKETFVESFRDWLNDNKAGQETLQKHGGKLTLMDVMSEFWPLPEKMVKALRDKGVRVYSIGIQSWTTQQHWALDDNLVEETQAPVMEDPPTTPAPAQGQQLRPCGSVSKVSDLPNDLPDNSYCHVLEDGSGYAKLNGKWVQYSGSGKISPIPPLVTQEAQANAVNNVLASGTSMEGTPAPGGTTADAPANTQEDPDIVAETTTPADPAGTV